jgi:hypothetical protein
MAAHFGTVVTSARTKKPRDKAKVEVGVKVIERWILAALRNWTFFSLDELTMRRSKERFGLLVDQEWTYRATAHFPFPFPSTSGTVPLSQTHSASRNNYLAGLAILPYLPVTPVHLRHLITANVREALVWLQGLLPTSSQVPGTTCLSFGRLFAGKVQWNASGIENVRVEVSTVRPSYSARICINPDLAKQFRVPQRLKHRSFKKRSYVDHPAFAIRKLQDQVTVLNRIRASYLAQHNLQPHLTSSLRRSHSQERFPCPGSSPVLHKGFLLLPYPATPNALQALRQVSSQ